VAADGGEETSPVVPVAELDGAYVPDLSATGLSMAQVVERPFVGNHSALVVGYTGTRGCRLTLVIARLGWPLEEAFTRHGEAGHVAYSWRAGSLGFILLAEAMDADRFELIAHSVYRASIEHLPFDDKTRMALMKNRRASKPCLT
jgi:hypothetical protein